MRQRSSFVIFVGLGVAVIVVVWLFRDSLRGRITRHATLANPAPPPELIEEMIEAASDRSAAILAAWNTRKIVQRQAAMREISRAFPNEKTLPTELETIVLAG